MKRAIKNIPKVLIDIILFGIFLAVLTPYILSLLFEGKPYFIVSNSMTHVKGSDASFNRFWQNYGFNEQQGKKLPFNDGLEFGDLVLVKKNAFFEPGDVIAYFSTASQSGALKTTNPPTIHRVVSSTETHFSTIGDKDVNQLTVGDTDHNPNDLEEEKIYGFDLKTVKEKGVWLKSLTSIEYQVENNIPISSYIGKVILRIPRIGYGYIALNCIKNESCSLSQCLLHKICSQGPH